MPNPQVFTAEEIASFRAGGAILRGCLESLRPLVGPSVTTGELDVAAETYIRQHGGRPAFKGYRGFPATLCTSVNEECVHGIPGRRMLNEGDIVKLDCGVIYDALYTDACISVPVGRVSPEAAKLLSVTEQALEHALAVVHAGAHVGDIGRAVESFVEAHGFHPVPALTGHGLGRSLHQFPDIPNLGKRGKGPLLPLHTVIAIEPIISAGSSDVRVGVDGWTLSIADGALAAHFEHSVLVTEEGCEVLA
jgi:methionyl aminopeptidase